MENYSTVLPEEVGIFEVWEICRDVLICFFSHHEILGIHCNRLISNYKLQTLQPTLKPQNNALSEGQSQMSLICQKCPHSEGWNSNWVPQRHETHTTMCCQLWPVSCSDSTVCSCNTMAHYLESHTHTHTMGQLQAIRLVKIDPFSTLKQLPFLLLTNQNGGLAESVMWNRGLGSTLQTKGTVGGQQKQQPWSFTLSHSHRFSLLCYTQTHMVYKHNRLHTHAQLYSESFALKDLHCGLLLWIEHFGDWLCVLQTGVVSVWINWTHQELITPLASWVVIACWR